MVEGRNDSKSGGRIRLGMVGGGQGAFIGAVHRIASRIDDNYEVVAGALSSQRQRAIDSALEIGIARDRAYGDFEDMAKAEAKRKGDGIEAVAIVTPNYMHAAPIKAFLKAGIHVICDKPLAMSVTEAKDIVRAVKRSGKIFALTHNYTGYPMIRQARALVAAGELGEIRHVQAEYAQDWLTERLEATGQKQADWRTDPKRAGAGALGDIATHAYNLACFVTGLQLDSLCADLSTFVKGRKLDDDNNILLRWKGGAKGMLWASQVAPGNENNLSLRVYGSKGGLAWRQEDPNYLWFTPFGQPTRLITRAGVGAGPEAARVTRTPSGHPEGYLEGFANIYAEVARAIRAARTDADLGPEVMFPTVEDGLAGMQFIDAAVKSNAKGGGWVKI